MLWRVIVLAVLLILVLRAIRLLVQTLMSAAGAAPPQVRPPTASSKLARDPVCGTHVPMGSAVSLTARGTTHYFCSEECRAKFAAR